MRPTRKEVDDACDQLELAFRRVVELSAALGKKDHAADWSRVGKARHALAALRNETRSLVHDG